MIKLLIVDDSAVVRAFLKDIFDKDREIEVVGTAPDPYVARDKILRYEPDVITLDVEMPRMDGITFLKKLMTYHPVPVVILSSLTQKGAATTLQAMEEGAVDIIAKPEMSLVKGLEQISLDITSKVKAAAQARVAKRGKAETKKTNSSKPIQIQSKALKQSTHKIIAIGASTGGTEAIKAVLTRMPPDAPAILIVQHMPEKFTKAFAERLNTQSAMEVREAKNGDGVLPGTALIAPGSYHMVLRRDGARYFIKLNQEEPVHHQRPSVDVLFDSVATYAGTNATGVLMTGMGSDGASGLLKMREAGALTIAQDEESSVVYGMPKEAVTLDAVDRVCSLDNIPVTMLSFATKEKRFKSKA